MEFNVLKEISFDNSYIIDHPYSKAYNFSFFIDSHSSGDTLNLFISDVSQEVSIDDEFDRFARLVGFTRFASQTQQLLFPETFINNNLSFNSQDSKSALCISCQLDKDGDIVSCNFSRARLKNCHIYSYYDAQQLIDLKSKNTHSKQLQKALILAKNLFTKRKEMQSLCYFNTELGLYCNEFGILSELDKFKKFPSFLISFEYQLLSQFLVGAFFKLKNISALYHSHYSSLHESVSRETLLNDLYQEQTPQISLYNHHLKKLAQKTLFTTKASTHFAQNVTCFASIWDPIYRYASLVNQRILFSIIDQKELPYTKEHLSCIAINNNILHKNTIKKNYTLVPSLQEIKIMLEKNSLSQSNLSYLITDHLLSCDPDIGFLESYITPLLTQNNLFPYHIYQLCILSKNLKAFEPIQTMLIEYLEQMPGLAIQVINIACQSHPLWENYELEDVSTPTLKYTMRVCVNLNGIKRTTKQPSYNSRKHVAKDVSAVEFIKKYLQNNLVLYNEREAYKENIKDSVVKNEISELNELCQRNNWSISFDTMMTVSQSKLPLFIVIVSISTPVKTFQSTGKANRKKEAKEMASLSMKKQFMKHLLNLEKKEISFDKYFINASKLYKYCKEANISTPNYSFDFELGLFRCTATLKDQQQLSFSAVSLSKIAAKDAVCAHIFSFFNKKK